MIVPCSMRNLPKINSEPYTLQNKILGMYMNLPIKPKENIESRLSVFQKITTSIL